MSQIKLSPNVSGTGIFTIASPGTSTDRTLTLPDQTGTLLTSSGPITVNASATAGAVTVDASNNVGIGVTPSASWATYKVIQIGEQAVFSGYATGAGVMNLGANFYWDGSGYKYLTTNPATLYQQNAGAHNWRVAASGTAGNAITFTQAMTLDASGNLLVGTTAVNNAGVISVDFTGQSKQGITLDDTYTSTGGAYILFRNSSGDTAGVISHNGTTTVAYTTSSDHRLKEDVQPMQNALATVSALKPVTYKWKSDGLDGQGFIAHELQEVCPDAVVGEKDAVNEDGSIKPQGIDTSFLVATLTAAIQEQQALITSLTARIAALEAA